MRRPMQGFLYLCLLVLICYVIKVDIIRCIMCFDACSIFREASSKHPQPFCRRAAAKVRTTVNESGKTEAMEREPSVSFYIAWEFGPSQPRAFEVLFDNHIHSTSRGTRYYFHMIFLYTLFTRGSEAPMVWLINRSTLRYLMMRCVCKVNLSVCVCLTF